MVVSGQQKGDSTARPAADAIPNFPETEHDDRGVACSVVFSEVDGPRGLPSRLQRPASVWNTMLLSPSTLTRYGITSTCYENKTTCVCIGRSRT